MHGEFFVLYNDEKESRKCPAGSVRQTARIRIKREKTHEDN
jgi:hypothetical protein